MEQAIVIGNSPAARNTAVYLATRDIQVRLLSVNDTQQDPNGRGLQRGAVRLHSAQDTERLEALWGLTVPFPGGDVRRGMWMGGQRVALPISPRDLMRVYGVRGLARTATEVAKCRLGERVGQVVSLGQEMRSYRDWLTQSVGPHASRILYEPYARKRFGTAPDELTALLAWNTHASCQPDAWRVAAASQEQVWESGRQRIFEAGGEIIEGVNLQGFEVEDGRVVSLLTDHGREWIEACVFVDADSRTMLSWLPEALVDAPFRFDASRLPLLHRLEVTLPADVDALPWELHVVDEELPFWKLSKPGILPGRSQWLQHVTAHLTVHDKHPLWVADDATVAAAVKGALQAIAKVGSGPAVVQRWAQRVPTPSLRTQPCLGRILERYDKLGIVGIGAAGAYRQMRPTEQVQFVDTVLSSTPVKGSVMNQRETHRNLFEGQVLVPRRGSLRIGITD